MSKRSDAMENQLEIVRFRNGWLTIIRGEEDGSRKFKVTVGGNAIYLTTAEALELAREVDHWASQPSTTTEK